MLGELHDKVIENEIDNNINLDEGKTKEKSTESNLEDASKCANSVDNNDAGSLTDLINADKHPEKVDITETSTETRYPPSSSSSQHDDADKEKIDQNSADITSHISNDIKNISVFTNSLIFEIDD